MEVIGQLNAPATLPTVGPRAVLDVVEKRKSLSLPGIEARLSGPWQCHTVGSSKSWLILIFLLFQLQRLCRVRWGGDDYIR